jgi:hypothetical protein
LEVKDQLNLRIMSKINSRVFASFRDNSGFIYTENGEVFRVINEIYRSQYTFLMTSGLYDDLVSKNLLISHEEVTGNWESGYNIIKPFQLPIISYPYSWSFSMLKDAALLTLKIQKEVLAKGMVLKDASVYNVQFVGVTPMFIDTLSFEYYQENTPWIAYSQFCQHFLAPLALMSYTDVSLNKLLLSNIDGIPLPLVAKLLPFRAKLNFSLYLHIFTQAKFEKKVNTASPIKVESVLSKKALLNIINSLYDVIKNLKVNDKNTVWDEYYQKDVDNAYLLNKRSIIEGFLKTIKPSRLLDLGANDGYFTQLARECTDAYILSYDIDTNCVERNYLNLKNNNTQYVTPLHIDVMNPDPSIGWYNQERESIWKRTNVDTILALAIVHHLCIANNLPLDYLATFFAENCDNLIIEFVPKSDIKVQILLANREDIFDDYSEEYFEEAFLKFFVMKNKVILIPTERILYEFCKI